MGTTEKWGQIYFQCGLGKDHFQSLPIPGTQYVIKVQDFLVTTRTCSFPPTLNITPPYQMSVLKIDLSPFPK